jgi:TolB protein
LTDNGGTKFDPAWSASGRRLAFVWEGVIWILNVETDHARQLTSPPGRVHDGHPTWSPDGTQLAFERFPGIWVINDDGSGEHLLQHSDRRFDRAPDWSPDGQRIAFTSVRRGGTRIHRTDVWTMNVSGRDRIKVTDDEGWDYDPSWSPDGSMIAYEHFEAIDASSDLVWIHVINADGSGMVELNPTGAEHPADIEPSWSPNGNRIVFWSYGLDSLATMRPDGSDLQELGIHGYGPAWRPVS